MLGDFWTVCTQIVFYFTEPENLHTILWNQLELLSQRPFQSSIMNQVYNGSLSLIETNGGQIQYYITFENLN